MAKWSDASMMAGDLSIDPEARGYQLAIIWAN